MISVRPTRSEQASERARKSIFLSVFAVLFGAVLLVLYANDIAIRYAYTGASWNPEWIAIVIGFISVAITALWLPVRLERPGDLLVYVLFCMVFVPATLLPGGTSGLPAAQLIPFQMVLLVCFLVFTAANRLPLIPIKFQLPTKRSYAIFLLGFTALMAIPVVYYYGIPTSLPSLADVYSIRLESRAAQAAMPAVVGYLWFWLAKVSVPFLFNFGLVTRSNLLTISGIAISLYLYGLTGSKTVVFSVGLVTAVVIVLKLLARQALLAIIPAITIFIPVAYAVDLVVTDYWLTSLIARRTFMVPGTLTGYYLEYFSENPHTRWSYSLLSGFFENPYGNSMPPGIIGREYFLEHTAANAHIWADGFANFGYSGMLIVSVLVGILVWVFNAVSHGKSLLLTTPLAALVGYTLANGALFTAMVTHGVLLILVFLLLLPDSPPYERSGLQSGAVDESKNERL